MTDWMELVWSLETQADLDMEWTEWTGSDGTRQQLPRWMILVRSGMRG